MQYGYNSNRGKSETKQTEKQRKLKGQRKQMQHEYNTNKNIQNAKKTKETNAKRMQP